MFCKNCKTKFDENNYSWWNENGSSASVKYCACPGCNSVTILKYIYDYDYRVTTIKHDYHIDKYKDYYEKLLKEEKE